MQFKSTIELKSLTVESVQGLQVGQYIKCYGRKMRFLGIKEGVVHVVTKNIGSFRQLVKEIASMKKTAPVQLFLW
jgi:hypothetical protein|tara:strand:+ start:249 stop:473 length:225 start_codon:yes stop_codon:yes gene_type:complete